MAMREPLVAGMVAPDFRLRSEPSQTVSLAELRGHPVVLLFYPADFSPVCSSEMTVFNEILPEFEDRGAQLLGVSVDNVWTHLAFAEDANLHFPLLADFHPKGEVARRYGVYRDEVGEAERALYVIDRDGVVTWSYVSPVDVSPGAEGVLQALELLELEREL